MGREWLNWVGGGRRRRSITQNEEAALPGGCICAVLQIFDLHHFQLPLNHQHSFHHTHFLQQQATTSKAGVKAPRNSLELEEPEPPAAIKPASKPLAMEEHQNLNIPVGIHQIRTRASTSRTEDDCSVNSPGTKTPNLVARLMGLDLLPESPSLSCKPQTITNIRSNTCFYEDDISIGARSLPETRSDVEYHRLSLQINKENRNEEFVKIRGKRGTRFREEGSSSSPGHYAKQIVKQVRESVSRRVGLTDITNTEREEIRRDQNLLLLKLNKKKLDNETTPSCSPKLRFLDTKKNKPVADLGIKSPRNSGSSPKNKVIIVQEQQVQKKVNLIKNKKEEAYVRKAKLIEKKGPLSSELLHISGPTLLLPVKKGPSPPPTKLPQKQSQAQVSSSDAVSSKRNTQLSSNRRHSYNYEQQHHQPDNTNGCATTSAAAPDYKCYIQKILKRAGIVDKFTPGKWHTPSHPLDPSIFYYLELFHPTSHATFLSCRSNRKLIFQLVDELLAELLRPQMDFKTWISPIASKNDHISLDDELCKKIESFPAAKCQVLEDIDSLIDKNLGRPAYYEEEGESLVREIEGEIVARLVSETVAMVGGRTDDEGRRQIRWVSRDPRV